MLAVLLLIGGLGGWLTEQYSDWLGSGELNSPVPQLTSIEANFPEVKSAAFESCMCLRDGVAEASCAAIYEDARDAMLRKVYGSGDLPNAGPSITACAPVSSENECFEFTDGVECVDTRFHVNCATGEFPTKIVCTIEEARAIEHAYALGWLRPDGKKPGPDDPVEWSAANKRANRAVNDMLGRILAGESLPSTESGSGCSG